MRLSVTSKLQRSLRRSFCKDQDKKRMIFEQKMANAKEAKAYIKTMNFFHRVLYRRKLSRATAFIFSLTIPVGVLACINGEELPMQAAIKQTVNSIKRAVYRQQHELQRTPESMVKFTSKLVDLFKDSYATGFYDIETFLATVAANQELLETYAFADIRTSLKSLQNVAELLVFVQQKNAALLLKDERIKQAYLAYILAVKRVSSSC